MHTYASFHGEPLAILGNDQLYLDNSKLMVIACVLTVLLAAATWRMWKGRAQSR